MNKKRLQSLVFNNFQLPITLFIIANLSACVATTQTNPRSIKQPLQADLICTNVEKHANQVVGDGHCVSLIKQCSGAPPTKHWKPGEQVLGSTLHAGTVIATFKNGRYPNETSHHAAIYIKQDKHGIWVWDQWLGKKVHKRLIRIRSDGAAPGNTAQAYRVVRIK